MGRFFDNDFPMSQSIDELFEDGLQRYQAGSWGPTKGELLIEKDGRSWNS